MRACQWSGVAIIDGVDLLVVEHAAEIVFELRLAALQFAISPPVFSRIFGSRSQKVLKRAPARTARRASPFP